MKHRIPPKPIHYDTAEPGQCRFCGEDVLNRKGVKNLRANWHKPCVAEYKILYWPSATRRAVWNRDHGKCAACGIVNPRRGAKWHVDHRIPLIEAEGDISKWRLDNLDTLCLPCHHAKTAAEATARAAARRKR